MFLKQKKLEEDWYHVILLHQFLMCDVGRPQN